jgi:hypothetical protein
VLAAEGVEAGLEHAAQGLLDEVAGDEGGGIDGTFLFAAATDGSGAMRLACLFFCCYSAGQGRRDALPHYRIGRRDALPHYAAGMFEALAQAFEVGDGLLEDVAQDVHVNDRADGGAFGGVGDLAGGAVIVVAQFLEMGAGEKPSGLNILHPTSDIQHPRPERGSRRKGARKPSWISLPD